MSNDTENPVDEASAVNTDGTVGNANNGHAVDNVHNADNVDDVNTVDTADNADDVNTVNDVDNAHNADTVNNVDNANDVNTVDNVDAVNTVDGAGKGADESYGSFVKSFLTRGHVIVICIILCIAVAAPFAWMYWLRPLVDRHPLSAVDDNVPIVMYDHTWDKTQLSGELSGSRVNTTQYILHYKDDAHACYAFHAEGKDPVNTLRITMVIGEEKSRNLLQAQASAFAYGMREGRIGVEVCPLISDDEYSVLASEALGEVDWNEPGNTWNALIKLTMVDTSELTTTDERVDSILKTLGTIPNVSKNATIQRASLLNGSFMQNARQMSNEHTSKVVPALWMNNVNISDGTAFRLYDYKSFYDYLNTLPAK